MTMKNLLLFVPLVLCSLGCEATSLESSRDTASNSASNSAGSEQAAQAADASARPGFEVFAQDGRLTVFRSEDPELVTFRKHQELGKSVTKIGAGPRGETVKAPDSETILAYSYSRPGFVTRVVDGRIWVFEAGTEAWQQFLATGEPAKSVTKIGVGPQGATVKAPDADVITRWLAAL